jgi:hypothetical protein
LPIAGEYGTYGSKGFIFDFGYDRVANRRAIKALNTEKWLDANTRAIVLTWTVATQQSNPVFTFTLLIETLGNNLFLSRLKLQ